MSICSRRATRCAAFIKEQSSRSNHQNAYRAQSGNHALGLAKIVPCGIGAWRLRQKVNDWCQTPFVHVSAESKVQADPIVYTHRTMSNKSLNLYVAGGYDPQRPDTMDRPPEDFAKFGGELGKAIIRQGHTLLNGCMTEFDADVAKGAFEYLTSEQRGDEIENRIRCYVPEKGHPIHEHGCVMESSLTSWDMGSRSLKAPEVIRDADVVLLVGGYTGTFKAANWARVKDKPILSFTTFGGASEEIYQVEFNDNGHLMDEDDRFQHERVLKSRSEDWPKLATMSVEFAEKTATSSDVFVIMSFKDAAEFDNVNKCYKAVCKDFHYEAARVDESNQLNRILPEILKRISSSAFVLADISEPSPNVYYEVGFAEGAGKQIVFTARQGTELPFDVRDTPVIFYDSFEALKERLRSSIREVARTQGRSIN